MLGLTVQVIFPTSTFTALPPSLPPVLDHPGPGGWDRRQAQVALLPTPGLLTRSRQPGPGAGEQDPGQEAGPEVESRGSRTRAWRRTTWILALPEFPPASSPGNVATRFCFSCAVKATLNPRRLKGAKGADLVFGSRPDFTRGVKLSAMAYKLTATWAWRRSLPGAI